MKMNIFISQPMTGRTNEEILLERRKVEEYLQDLYGPDLNILNSFIQDPSLQEKPIYCLGQAISQLNDADLVIFLEGWKESRGCNIEFMVCTQYNLQVDFLNKDDFWF
jgi:hypothetical protein